MNNKQEKYNRNFINMVNKENLEYKKLRKKRTRKNIKKQNKFGKVIKYRILPAFLVISTYNITNKIINKDVYFKLMNNSNIYNNRNLLLSKEEEEQIENDINKINNIDTNEYNKKSLYLLKAIVDNKKLTDEEKDEVYKIIEIVDDNKYTNLELSYKRLRNLDIEYKQTRPFYVKEETLGSYYSLINQINIYEDNEKFNVKTHELIHSIYYKNNETIPTYFKEGMTELLNNEYYSENPFYEDSIYIYEICYVKILCNLLGSDTILETYTKADINILIDELEKITKDKFIASKIAYLDDKQFEKEKVNETDKKYIKDTLNIIKELMNKKIKDTEEIDKDLIKSYESLYYNIGLYETCLENDYYKHYINYIEKNGLDEKAYFNKELNTVKKYQKAK